MNYEQIYNQLIENRKINKVSKKTQYCEVHHIIPRSFGGSNESLNKVTLTGREHIIAHKLLVRISKQKYGENSHEYRAMCFAIWRMIHKNGVHINSREAERIKREYSLMYSNLMKTDANPQKGKPSAFRGCKHTNETRAQISRNRKGKCIGKENHNYGKNPWKNLTSEQVKNRKDMLSKRFSGENNPMYGKNIKDYMSDDKYKEWCLKNSISHQRNNLSEATLKKMSDNNRGANNSQFGIKCKDRMDPETYRLWKIHQKEANSGCKNPAYGRKWMFNPETNTRAYVKKEDIQKYIDNGFRFGQK